LKSLDFLPGFQSPTHGTKIELFEEDRSLVHTQEHIASYLLVSEDFAMLGLNPCREKIFCNLI
jgi:hypothetical protein